MKKRKPHKRKQRPAPGSPGVPAVVPQSARATVAGIPPSVVAATPAATVAEAIERVLVRIEGRELVTAACAAEGLGVASLYDWRDASDENAKRFARARTLQAHGLAESALEVAGRTAVDIVDVAGRRLQFDAMKWFLTKVAPADYGDRVQVDGAVQHRVFVDLDELSAPPSGATTSADVSSGVS